MCGTTAELCSFSFSILLFPPEKNRERGLRMGNDGGWVPERFLGPRAPGGFVAEYPYFSVLFLGGRHQIGGNQGTFSDVLCPPRPTHRVGLARAGSGITGESGCCELGVRYRSAEIGNAADGRGVNLAGTGGRRAGICVIRRDAQETHVRCGGRFWRGWRSWWPRWYGGPAWATLPTHPAAGASREREW